MYKCVHFHEKVGWTLLTFLRQNDSDDEEGLKKWSHMQVSINENEKPKTHEKPVHASC